MDLNHLLYHHQLCLIQAESPSVASRPGALKLAVHYQTRIDRLRRELGISRYPDWHGSDPRGGIGVVRSPRTIARRAQPGRGGTVGTDCHALKRRSEAFDLAFLLLGGRRAANSFLDTPNPGLSGIPRMRADTSALGLIEVVRVLRRHALNAPHAMQTL